MIILLLQVEADSLSVYSEAVTLTSSIILQFISITQGVILLGRIYLLQHVRSVKGLASGSVIKHSSSSDLLLVEQKVC